MDKLDVYWCRGCDNNFATETDKAKPLNCPYCLQQMDFIYKKTIEVSDIKKWL